MASFSGICSSSSALKLQNQSPRLTNLLRKELIAFPTGPKLASDRSWSQSVARDIPGELSSVNDRAIEKEKRGMKKHPRALWRRYVDWLCQHKELGLYIDVSQVGFTNEFLQQMEPGFQSTFRAMEELERGTIANPDEGCMVGHYWLRDSKRAPNSFLKAQIDNTIDAVCNFANDVVSGNIKPPSFPEGCFTQILSVGIGGSALGPQFVAEALAPDNPPLKIRFIDNTDPAGIDHQIAQLGPELG